MEATTELPMAAARDLTTVTRLCWREARPVVQLIFQLRFAAAALPAIAAAPTALSYLDGTRILLGSFAWLCTTWHIYLLNGVCDRTEDRVNASTRPLAAGVLRCAQARQALAVLAVAAFGCALAVSGVFVALVAAMLGLGWLYSAGPRPQKANVPGFMVVVVGGGMLTYLAGWSAAGGGRPSCQLCLLGVAMSLWMATAGMTKDLSDAAGDRAAGRRTLPILFGEGRARSALSAIVLAVGSGTLFVAYLLAAALLPACAVLGHVQGDGVRDDHREDPG
jgi:4-hydroxybenzoate polyprenyltransferase